ncbi:MAG: metal-dependent hydrolase [Gemmatimonadota bacterium]
MDNLTHTMAGALLAECGLKRHSRLAYPALLIGANLPDIDVASYLFGDGLTGLTFRRGWTHGVLAMVVLPVVLTLLLITWSRYRRSRSSVVARASRAPVAVRPLIVVAAIGIWSHPLLDLLNNYGVRLLMPFSDRWFYGDAIYIVDPWILALLIGGTWLSRRRARQGRSRRKTARVALVGLLAYVATMIYISHASVRLVADAAGRNGILSPRTIMMSPDPALATTRTGLLDSGNHYERWRVDWRPWGSRVERLTGDIPKGDDDPRAALARATERGRRYLAWSRFPFFVCGVDGDPALVHLGDARYSEGPLESWSTTRVRVTPGAP